MVTGRNPSSSVRRHLRSTSYTTWTMGIEPPPVRHRESTVRIGGRHLTLSLFTFTSLSSLFKGDGRRSFLSSEDEDGCW
ncbi:hypothetical protein Hanom_Chr14g01288091 [Helianthus anomalus]